jgi:parvulin-like peptidyl-prolyl isomerase
MKALSLFIFLCVSTGWTQSAPAQAAPAPAAPLPTAPAPVASAPVASAQAAPATTEKGDTVIATFADDGYRMTLDEYQALLRANSKWQGQDRQQVIRKYAMLRKAAALAKSQKLDQKSPYKESLDFTNLVSMAEIELTEATNSITVDAAEIEKYYNQHKDPFKLIKVSGIKVAFGPAAAPADTGSKPINASRVPKKALTQEEAKAKAEKLVAQVRAGADFAKLVQLESDDETSKAKGGDLGTWRMSDNVPDNLRVAVMNLKEGEVSEPVLQAGGYYVVHADAITYTPLADVKDTIFTQLKQQHAQEWMQNLEKNTQVEFPAQQPPPAPGAPLPDSAK